MFDTNEDFDIDEDFLKSEGSTLNQIISSTPLSNSVDAFNSRKVVSPVKNAGPFNSTKSNNKISIFESGELLNENFLDTEFTIEDELEKKIQKQFTVNGTKRPFSEILKNENKKICINNSESNRDLIEHEKHVNKILNIVKNAPLSQNLSSEKILDQNIFKIIPEENKTINSFNDTVQPSNTVIRKRKFPGPAGLLPEINSIDEITKIKLDNLEDAPTENPLQSVTVCSQDTVTKFHQSPWKRMLQDYDINHENQISLPQKYTIAWLKNIANINRLNQRKAPFLAAIVDSINSTRDDCVVKLKDKTGEIDGVIDTEAWEKLNPILIIGSVIVLHQVGILTFSLKKHYLNITSNNIVVVYSPSETSHDVIVTKGSHYLNYIELYESIVRQQLNSASSLNKSNNTNLLSCLKKIETKPNIYSNPIPHSSNSNINPSNNSNFINTSLPSTSRNLNLTPHNKNRSENSPKPTINNKNNTNFTNTSPSTLSDVNLTSNNSSMPGTSPKFIVNKNKPKFNFAKVKLNQFAYKPRDNTEESVNLNNSNCINNSEDVTKPNTYSNPIPHSSNFNFNASNNSNFIDTSYQNMLENSPKPTINNRNNTNFPNTSPSTSSDFNLTSDNSSMLGTSPKSIVNKNKSKFNFAKVKLNQFAYKPRDKTEETSVDITNSNRKNNSEDIESIISSTFAGIDADSFFDDF